MRGRAAVWRPGCAEERGPPPAVLASRVTPPPGSSGGLQLPRTLQGGHSRPLNDSGPSRTSQAEEKLLSKVRDLAEPRGRPDGCGRPAGRGGRQQRSSPQASVFLREELPHLPGLTSPHDGRDPIRSRSKCVTALARLACALGHAHVYVAVCAHVYTCAHAHVSNGGGRSGEPNFLSQSPHSWMFLKYFKVF